MKTLRTIYKYDSHQLKENQSDTKKILIVALGSNSFDFSTELRYQFENSAVLKNVTAGGLVGFFAD